MTHQDFIDLINAALGPREIASVHLYPAGAKILVDREKISGGTHLWVSEKEKQQAVEHDFCWTFKIDIRHVGPFKSRPAEIQALPHDIYIHAWSIEALTRPQEEEDSLLSELLFLFNDRFPDHISWYKP